MANILSLAMKISADATGVRQSLTPVERALDAIDTQTKATAAVFAEFAKTSAAAAAAQLKVGTDVEALNARLKSGEITAKQYADSFAAIQQGAKELAQSFSEGARLTEQLRTEEEKRAVQLEKIDALLRVGAITEELAARARAEASGANAEAAKAEKARADAVAAAARIIQANITPQERYDQQLQELRGHLDEGRLSQEQFNRAAAKAKTDLDRAGDAADKAGKDIDKLSRNVSLLTKIEVGRLLIDGFQALSNVFTRVAGEVTSLASTVNANIDRLNDFSARTGIGVEALQGYSLAAKLAGVDAEAFGTAIQKLSVNIGKANAGDEFDKSLRGIGLTVAELKALAPEQQFSAIGDAISQLPTAADRAAAAVQLFGKQGAALAPLFREGAASIEELQKRAENLGVIVSETQVNNVADMNDAFDLVRATVEGIVGQVIGNLAPAVTAVTEQFLKFVEEWSGAQGTGGTGIANAITDVLLQGAEYFAGIFDSFVSNFSGFTVTLADVGETFRFVVGIMTATSETLRAAFNVFELAGNAISMALGKLLEGIGSYVSSDLEAYGQELQRQAQDATDRNAKQLEEAAANAAGALTNAFTGGNSEAAGEGEAQKFVRGLRSGIENARLPEVKVQSDLAAATADLDQFLKTATDGTSEFLQQSQGTLSTFSQMAAEGELTADQIKIMNGFMERLNQELVKEKQLRQDATEASEKQADAERKRLEDQRKRVNELLAAGQQRTELERNIADVSNEIERVRQAQSKARESNQQFAADAATARLAQLDQLQAKLEDQQQAVEQGFGEGFTKAFEATNKGIDSLIVKAEEFGNVGAMAAEALRDGIEAAQQQVRDGILTRETYEKEVAQQRDVFAQRLSAAQRVEEFLRGQLDERQRAELDNVKALEERKKQAEVNIQAIKAKVLEEEKALAKARQEGDLAAAKAAKTRIDQLDQAQRGEQALLDGQQSTSRAQSRAFAESADLAKQFSQVAANQAQAFSEAARGSVDAANFALSKASEAAAKQAEFLRQLNTLGPTSVQTADVRTQQGAALVIGLAAQAQDPALIEARLQTRALKAIRDAIVEGTNAAPVPVRI